MNDEIRKESEAVKGLLREFIEDDRVLRAIASDCKGDPCECLYCRAKSVL